MDGLDCVVFDCDGVLVDAISSWRTLHDHFGTDNNANLQRFIAGEFDDLTFMRSDIALWKAVQDPIHQDDLFRAYAGARLMPVHGSWFATSRNVASMWPSYLQAWICSFRALPPC